MSAIFGGSKSTQNSSNQSSSSSHSGNQAYPWLQNMLGGTVQNGVGANNQLAGMLNGTDNGAGFQNYRNSAGYQSTLDAGSHAITGNAASRGLLSSGSTLKGLDQFGQATNQQYYNNYLGQLLGLSNSGNQAANTISGAGGYSDSQSQSTGTSSGTSKSKPGIGSFIGSVASAIPGL
jgi:hypothetical protein